MNAYHKFVYDLLMEIWGYLPDESQPVEPIQFERSDLNSRVNEIETQVDLITKYKQVESALIVEGFILFPVGQTYQLIHKPWVVMQSKCYPL